MRFALLAGAATSVFRPVLFAGVPNAVPDEQLPEANVLLQSAENLMVALGPAPGLANVSEVVLAKESLDAGDAGYGLMLTAVGAGLLAGSLVAGSAIERAGLRAAYTGALALLAAGAITAAAPVLWVAALSLLVAGIGNGIALVGNATIVQLTRGLVSSAALSASRQPA